MKRVWIKRAELERIKTLFREELGNNTAPVLIPIERVLPLLEKRDPARILWSRITRNEFRRWGLRVGIRNNQNAYKVQVVDFVQWRKAISGVESIDGHHPDPEPMVCDDLVPEPDPAYVFPEWTRHLHQSITSGEHVLLVGPTGSGKSSLVREICARENLRYMRVNLNGETSVSDIIGGWKVQGREMVYQLGPVPRAMKVGAVLCLDEIDAAAPHVLFALQPVLENEGVLFIPETSEKIIPHPDFRCMATANTCGRGDDSGLYAGTNVLNESFIDRFHCVYSVDYLPHVKEVSLLLNKVKGLNSKIAEKMVRAAADLRQALTDGVIYSTISTRKLLAWARKSVQIGSPKEAAIYTILNKISETDRNVVKEVLQRHGF